MKRTVSLSILMIAALLLAGSCFPRLVPSTPVGFTSASLLPDNNAEYANGTLTNPYSLNVWYDWVNVSNTQVIAYAIYATPDSPYPGPIANIVGQHLRLLDGTEVFVASALTKFEVYRDLNGDGIPQANFTSPDNELLYHMYTNMSDKFNMTPIQMVTENNVPHYQWGISYQNVYGYLGYATASNNLGGWGGYAAKLIFDHITLNYDFSMNGTISNLKTSFDIGKVTTAYAIDPNTVQVTNTPFSLDGLGLALLFTTSTYTSKPYQTTVDDQPYNSTAKNATSTNVDVASVAVGNSSAYDFVFGGNYTLNIGENNQTHQANIQTYPAEAQAVALTNLPIKIYQPALAQISFFANYLNLTDLFGGSWPNVSIDYNTSSFNYRICFPVWNGQQIIHDPVFVGYVAGSSQIPEFPTATVALVGLLTAATAIILIVVRISRQTKRSSLK